MKLIRSIGALTTLFLATQAAAAPDSSSLQVLDARIDAAELAYAATSKAADTICHNAGFAMGQREPGLTNKANTQFTQCMDAGQASTDAIGFVGYLYEQRSRLTGWPLPSGYACSGKPNLGAPQPDTKGHYTVCPKDPDNYSYKFWMITQVRMQVGSAKGTWSNGGLISMRRYNSEAECRAGIAKYEDYPSKVPYTVSDGVMVGDVCVAVFLEDVRELKQ